MNIPESILKRLDSRIKEDNFRTLRNLDGLADFSSNDYLGFSKKIRVDAEIHGATGSRLISGNFTEIEQLENSLTEIHNSESALIFNSGYVANLGVLSCVPHRHELIIYDELCHASIIDGIRLSTAKSYSYKHNDLEDLEKLLKLGKISYIVTESVFSMDGDRAPLLEILKLAKKYSAYIILDEAHALGVVSKFGLAEKLGVEKEIFIRIYTFGKALGCHGAVVCCDSKIRDYLINFSRPFIYSTGLPPTSIAAIRRGYELLESSEKQIEILGHKISEFRKLISRMDTVKNESAIFSVIIPGNRKCKDFSSFLIKNGFDIRAICAPTVPSGQERLRICIHSFNTEEEILSLSKLLLNYD